MDRGFWVKIFINLKTTIMSDETTKEITPEIKEEQKNGAQKNVAQKKVEPKDYTKGKKYSESQLKKLSKVKYLNHSSLTKNTKGINPGDIAYVGMIAALQLEKSGKAEILENRLKTKEEKEAEKSKK